MSLELVAYHVLFSPLNFFKISRGGGRLMKMPIGNIYSVLANVGIAQAHKKRDLKSLAGDGYTGYTVVVFCLFVFVLIKQLINPKKTGTWWLNW